MTDSTNTNIGSGSGTSALVTLTGISIPTTVGSYTYTMTVTYLDSASVTQTVICVVSLLVTSAALYGQINNPSQAIVLPADLTPYLPSLTVSNQSIIINLFSVVATNTGRIVIVVPDSYGTVTSITDNTSSNITAQFSVVNYVANNSKFHTTTSDLTHYLPSLT